MDAPLHFVDDALSIGRIPTEFFMGDCVVADLRSEPDAQLNVRLAKSYRGVKRVLLRTHHSNATKSSMYQPHGRLLTPEAISFLLDNGLQLLGTDRLSIDDSSGRDYHLHQLVLGAGSIILEGLLLSHVVPGEYILSAAPLLIPEAEASPVRAFLIRK